MSLSIRDQSQVWGFSAWSELNYLFTGNCQVEMLFSSDIIIERNETFLLFLLPQQTRQTDYEQSLIFLLLAVYDKQRSVSCEYTRPFILIQPHQAPWWSQRTEQTRIMKATQNYKQFLRRSTYSFTKASALSLQTI